MSYANVYVYVAFCLHALTADASTCNLFILFTSQRSGSTWTCQVLNSQPGVICGVPNKAFGVSEMMIQYSPGMLRKHSNMTHSDVTWTGWVRSAETAISKLEAICDTNNGVAGFKLMYDQVPVHIHEEFLDWLQRRRISVVHLVREATVLRIASHSQSSVNHATNATLAADLRKHAKKLSYPQGQEALVERCKQLEALNSLWQRTLMFQTNMLYHYVAYECLVGPMRDAYVKEVVRFIGGDPVSGSPFAEVATSLVQLHETSCDERVTDYDAIAKLLQGTRTAAACAMLSGSSVAPSRIGFPDYNTGRFCSIC